ncbi:Ger(x)C family germination protein [Paenibacillus taihuensis]|uniref:Ger(X)C family germination protein n=1 Tax=Paenibacillus taihuensis TaxID=1156355 RepID=A0A3D9RWN8_9BACL|nr:Ger(x)C family spore germination protein [Paenibacillus taihuensis]REE81042.1 Ger(x)C family germination protein [Paenibacillus taihuensis]
MIKVTLLRLVIILFSLLLLAGCGNESIVNRIRILSAVGFDREGELCKGTVAYPNYIQRKGSLAILKGQGKEPKLIMDQFERESPRKVKYNKVNSIVFSQAIAREGIYTAVSTIIRDPDLGNTLLLAVSSCSAEKLIESLDHQELENLPFNIVKQNMANGGVPPSNLHLFLHDYYSEGKDPSMPSLSLNEQRQIQIHGYALFKKDRLRIVLNTNEMTLFGLLQGKKVRGELAFNYKEHQYVLSLLAGRSSSKTQMRPAAFRYDINVDGNIRNLEGNRMSMDPSEAGALSSCIEGQLKAQLLALLKKIQANDMDSLGIGERFRSEDRNWKASVFYKKVYPTLQFNVNVNVHLKNSGAGE